MTRLPKHRPDNVPVPLWKVAKESGLIRITEKGEIFIKNRVVTEPLDRPLVGNKAASSIELGAILHKVWSGQYIRCALCYGWFKEADLTLVAVAELRLTNDQCLTNQSYGICDCCAPLFIYNGEAQQEVLSYCFDLKRSNQS